MKPVANWRLVLRHAWSVRLMIIAALLSGAEVTIQVVIAFGVATPIPSSVLAGFAGLTTIAAFIARFVAQEKLGAS